MCLTLQGTFRWPALRDSKIVIYSTQLDCSTGVCLWLFECALFTASQSSCQSIRRLSEARSSPEFQWKFNTPDLQRDFVTFSGVACNYGLAGKSDHTCTGFQKVSQCNVIRFLMVNIRCLGKRSQSRRPTAHWEAHSDCVQLPVGTHV